MIGIMKWNRLLITGAVIMLIAGCSMTKSNEMDVESDWLNDIKIEVLDESVMPSGTSYTISLKNESNHIIVQNNVYISHPITNVEKTQFIANKCKVETTGNKLNIKKGEEVILSAFIPEENYKNNELISSDRLQFEIIGYSDKLNEANQFTKSGDFMYFQNDR